MKSLLFFFTVFVSLNSFSQYDVDLDIECDLENLPEKNSYEIIYDYEMHQLFTDQLQNEERVLNTHELCYIASVRKEEEEVTVELDKFTKIIVYPNNVLTD